jgi:hypothetical protein
VYRSSARIARLRPASLKEGLKKIAEQSRSSTSGGTLDILVSPEAAGPAPPADTLPKADQIETPGVGSSSKRRRVTIQEEEEEEEEEEEDAQEKEGDKEEEPIEAVPVRSLRHITAQLEDMAAAKAEIDGFSEKVGAKDLSTDVDEFNARLVSLARAVAINVAAVSAQATQVYLVLLILFP